MAWTVFYAGLALFALWACWRDRDLFWIGLWLVVNCALSNAIQFGFILPIDDAAARLAAVGSLKPGPFTFVEAMTAVAVFCAWTNHRHESRSVALRLDAIVACNLISICFNVALAAFSPPDGRQVFLYEVTTNMIFAAECLLAFSIGAGNRGWISRFHYRRRRRRSFAASHAIRSQGATHP